MVSLLMGLRGGKNKSKRAKNSTGKVCVFFLCEEQMGRISSANVFHKRLHHLYRQLVSELNWLAPNLDLEENCSEGECFAVTLLTSRCKGKWGDLVVFEQNCKNLFIFFYNWFCHKILFSLKFVQKMFVYPPENHWSVDLVFRQHVISILPLSLPEASSQKFKRNEKIFLFSSSRFPIKHPLITKLYHEQKSN